MPQPSTPAVEELSKGFSNLSANTQSPTASAPFSSTFQSTFQSPGFTSTFSNNFSINLGPPKFSSINLPATGVNVPHVSSKLRPTAVNMDAASGTPPTEPAQSHGADDEHLRERRTKFRFKSKRAPRYRDFRSLKL